MWTPPLLNKFSLRFKMILWAFVFVAPIMGILSGTIWKASRSYETQMRGSIQQMLMPFSADIDAALSSVRLYVANLQVDPTLLDEENQQTPEGLTALSTLSSKISEDLTLYPQIDSVFLYYNGKLRFIQNYNRSYAQNRAAAIVLQERLDNTDINRQLFQDGYLSIETDNSYYIYIAARIGDGVAGCWFSTVTLLEDVSTVDFQGLDRVMLVDDQNNLLDVAYDTDAGRTLSQLQQGYLVTTTALQEAPFSLAVLWNEDVVLASVQQMNRGLRSAIIVACLLFIAYVIFVRTSLVRPIKRLEKAIADTVESSFAPISIQKGDGSEIEKVYRALNTMTKQIEDLKIQMYEEKLIKQQAQMQLFQLQIRPHFLLNALNSIVSFARMQDYEMVQKMTMNLATHCQYILYNPWFVTLEEELIYTQNFIDMQSTQHDTRYRYNVLVEDEFLDCEIPILGIQIFVENAIKHSRSLDRALEIVVRIDALTLEGVRYLRIVIEDNGNGFSADALAQLNSPVIQAPEATDHGIGIYNICQRLKILYNGRAWLHFANGDAGHGARVEIRLPPDAKEKEGGLQ